MNISSHSFKNGLVRLGGFEITKKVTITTAFYNSEENVSDYFDCVTNLDYPKEYLNILWADNGSTDNTKELASNFLKAHVHEYSSVKLLDVPRLPETNKKDFQIANVMNALFEHAKTDIINIDSDILAPPDAICKLRSINEAYKANICGGITAFIIPQQGKLVPVVNAFMFDSQNKRFSNVAQRFLSRNGTLNLPFMKIEVDSCGFALCFIEKRVFKRLKCYSASDGIISCGQDFIPCVDIHFCLDAKLLGFKVMVDTSLYFRHPTLSHEVHIDKDTIAIRYCR